MMESALPNRHRPFSFLRGQTPAPPFERTITIYRSAAGVANQRQWLVSRACVSLSLFTCVPGYRNLINAFALITVELSTPQGNVRHCH